MKGTVLKKPKPKLAAVRQSARDRVRKHRESLRAMGLRPIQIWVPDTRQPGFASMARRQCKAVKDVEHDEEVFDFMDAVMADTAWN